MPLMTDRSRRAIETLVKTDPEFVTLCEVLYGGVDADLLHSDVFEKRAPDTDGNTQRRIAIASNLLGLTAGGAAIGATLRDDRLQTGGKWARRLHATGQKMPKPIERATAKVGTKGAGRLAAGAVALQLANTGGDVVVARTLPKPDKVNKAIPKVEELAQGAYEGMQRVMPEAFKRGKHAKPASPLGQKIGGALHTPLEHKKATVGVGGALYASNKRGQKKGREQGFAQGYYSKADTLPDLELAGTFSKFDDAKRQAFGYASVVKKDGMPVIDRQGDYIDAEEMEKAAYHYVQKSRVGGDMHRRTDDDRAHHVSDLIESMVFTPEKCKAMGLPDEVSKKLEGHWWVGYQIHDEDTWQAVRKQGRTGFSIHGRGKRQETTIDELVGY